MKKWFFQIKNGLKTRWILWAWYCTVYANVGACNKLSIGEASNFVQGATRYVPWWNQYGSYPDLDPLLPDICEQLLWGLILPTFLPALISCIFWNKQKIMDGFPSFFRLVSGIPSIISSVLRISNLRRLTEAWNLGRPFCWGNLYDRYGYLQAHRYMSVDA